MPSGKRNTDSLAEQRQGETNSKPTKRSRVSRACDQCRASRERCDGEPQCQTCVSQNRSCTYKAQPKKRGIQPNYIRTLELTLAWLLQTFPEVESQLAESLPQDHHHISALLRGKDSEASEALHLAWRNSVVCKQIDQLLSGEAGDADGQFLANHDQSDVSRSNVVNTAYRSTPQSSLIDLNGLLPSTAGIEPISSASQFSLPREGQQNFSSDNAVLQLPDNALILLEHYFAFTHSWLPMTEKSAMLKLVYSYPTEGLARDRLVGAEHAELWSIMALASMQLIDESQRSQSRHIREVAEGLIPIVYDNFSFEVAHIRAMMILALIDIYGQRMLAAWLRIGTVVSLLLLFRILEKLNVTEKWCVHIHLAAFVIETTVALHLRVPGHMEISYIDTIGFVDEDGLEEWATWQDPFGSDQHRNQQRAPARSFSTLNELVRRSVNWRKDFVPYSSASEDVDEGKSVVFELLKNGSPNQNRLQPSVLVSSYGMQDGTSRKAIQDAVSSPATQHARASTSADWAQHNTPNTNLHRFMSIPNDSNNLASGEGTNSSPSGQLAPSFWMTSPPASQTADLASILGDNSAPSADLFEQFDTLLEYQDSNQQSQFYQNLGFAPDVELAEFFGSDYQPSDPILAYLNPTLYGLNQESDLQEPGLG